MRRRWFVLGAAAAALLVLGGPLLVPIRPAPDTVPARELAGPDARFATLEGVEVHHQVTGPDDGDAVVLLHHFYGNVATWRHVLAGLGDAYRPIAFDRPAFGLTERPSLTRFDGPNPYTRSASARITVGLLDHLGVDDAVLVGSSAGGTIALETYRTAPDRVRALVLLSPAITGDVGPPANLRAVMRSPQLRRLGPRLVRRFAGEIDRERISGNWHDPSRATAEDLEAYQQPLRVQNWDVGYWELFAAEDPPQLRDLLPRIEVPTLVVSGASDRVISSAWNRRTADAIPGARFVEIPACGHTPQEECPDELLVVLRDFLGELPTDRRG